MDIFAHVLWTNAAARGANTVADKKKKRFHVSPGWAAFWGVFPDFFAFTIPFITRMYAALMGSVAFSDMWGRGAAEEASVRTGFELAQYLYQYSHSLVIWAAVFIVVWIIAKRPRWELLGWALHILIDIPSHAASFYPTPFLFPLSDYRFLHGVSWGNKWYMIINYSLLLGVWGWIVSRKYLKK